MIVGCVCWWVGWLVGLFVVVRCRLLACFIISTLVLVFLIVFLKSREDAQKASNEVDS